MEALIVRYGLLMVLIGTAVEGDVTMMLGGVTAHLGLFRLPSAIAVGTLGSFVGDSLYYALGRAHSRAVRETRLYRRAQPSIDRFARRFGALQIIVARFVYGTRVASMVFWGVQGLGAWRFVLIDAAGCALWAVALGALGYALSGSAALLIGEVRRAEVWLLGALVGCAVLVLLYRALLRRGQEGAGKPPSR